MKTYIDNTKFLFGLSIVFGVMTFYFSLYLYYYELEIFCVNRGRFGELIWCYSPAGTFFPFPKESGSLTAIATSHSLIDYLMYYILIFTKFVYVAPLFFLILTLASVIKLIRLQRESIILKKIPETYPIDR